MSQGGARVKREHVPNICVNTHAYRTFPDDGFLGHTCAQIVAEPWVSLGRKKLHDRLSSNCRRVPIVLRQYYRQTLFAEDTVRYF